MESAATVFPRPGTRVTYAKAFESYNALEEAMLAKVYNESFIPSVKMYDLMWEIDSVANKYDIKDAEEFRNLHIAMLEFSSERTALANGVNGERFYLLQDKEALSRHDDTHIFEVHVDGVKLLSLLDECLEAIEKERYDEYADVYSPESPELYHVDLVADRCESGGEEKWITRCFIGISCVIGISLIVHMVMHAMTMSRMMG